MKRVPLSINISEHAKAALLARAEREGHRYPAAFAAHLLERAIEGGGGGVDVEAALKVATQIADVVTLLRREASPVKADRVEKIARELEGVFGRLRAALGQEDSDGE